MLLKCTLSFIIFLIFYDSLKILRFYVMFILTNVIKIFANEKNDATSILYICVRV